MSNTVDEDMEMIDGIEGLRKHVSGIKMLATDILANGEDTDAVERAQVITSLCDMLEHDILTLANKIKQGK